MRIIVGMRASPIHILIVWLVGMQSICASHAARPEKSREALIGAASHVLRGAVVRTYERSHKTSEHTEVIYGVAEMVVAQVEKGSDIAVGERIFVRYWRKHGIGAESPWPGDSGHAPIPEVADMVLVYVIGDRKSGFDVLLPNGFVSADKPPDL